MMRAAYLDCSSGISGDMFIAALVDAGVPLAPLRKAISDLHLDAELKVSQVERCGIAASKVDASVGGRVDHYAPGLSHVLGFAREDEGRSHPSASLQAISLAETADRIRGLRISPAAKQKAAEMLQALAKAEGVVHGLELADVRFHPLAISDVLVDIVCAAVGVDSLDTTEWVCSPLNVGGGTIATTHGRFAVPAPVVAELLRSVPYYSSEVSAELVTPTGAAIVATVVNRFAETPELQIERVAYGAGASDFPTHANVLRLLLGKVK